MIKLSQVNYKGKNLICTVEDKIFTLSFSTKASSTLELIKNYAGNNLTEKISSYKEEAEVLYTFNEQEIHSLNDLKWQTCINAPEVWAVGVTYKRQAKEHDNDIKATTSKTDDLYSYVYESERAEVFFKGFQRTTSAHNENISLRGDSSLVMPEAESVLVLGDNAKLLGFTYGNDLTAWDIEKECPLYLNQAKIWDNSAAVGQFIIPYECVSDPYDFTLNCKVERDGKEIINSTGTTKDLKRSYEELIYFLTQNNTVPAGTLLFTGTACIIPHDFSLKENDIVTVEKKGYGLMKNKVTQLTSPEKNYKSRY